MDNGVRIFSDALVNQVLAATRERYYRIRYRAPDGSVADIDEIVRFALREAAAFLYTPHTLTQGFVDGIVSVGKFEEEPMRLSKIVDTIDTIIKDLFPPAALDEGKAVTDMTFHVRGNWYVAMPWYQPNVDLSLYHKFGLEIEPPDGFAHTSLADLLLIRMRFTPVALKLGAWLSQTGISECNIIALRSIHDASEDYRPEEAVALMPILEGQHRVNGLNVLSSGQFGIKDYGLHQHVPFEQLDRKVHWDQTYWILYKKYPL